MCKHLCKVSSYLLLKNIGRYHFYDNLYMMVFSVSSLFEPSFNCLIFSLIKTIMPWQNLFSQAIYVLYVCSIACLVVLFCLVVSDLAICHYQIHYSWKWLIFTVPKFAIVRLDDVVWGLNRVELQTWLYRESCKVSKKI